MVKFNPILTKAKEIGLLGDDNSPVSVPDLFWCNRYRDDSKEIIQDGSACCFMHFVGLPKRKGMRHPIYPWQMRFLEKLESSQKKFMILKPPKIGATFLLLYWSLHQALINPTWKNGQVAIVVATSGNEDDDSHKKSSDAGSDDSENKEETKKANQLEEELEKEKAKTASLTKFVTESMVNEMIAAAQSNGTPEKQLVAMRKEFESADIDTLIKTKALVASFAPNITSNITTDIPDPAHALSASTEEISDDDLMRRLYS